VISFRINDIAFVTKYQDRLIYGTDNTICRGGPQERVHGAAYYLARYGSSLIETLITQAENGCPGHAAIWL
jgi:hypothetical protein